MENLYKLIEHALETDLHDIAVEAKAEWAKIKAKLDDFEKDSEDYVAQEFPKWVNGKLVHNETEEIAAKPTSLPEPPAVTEKSAASITFSGVSDQNNVASGIPLIPAGSVGPQS